MKKQILLLGLGLFMAAQLSAQTSPEPELKRISPKQFAFTYTKDDIAVMKDDFRQVVALYPGLFYTLDTSIHDKPLILMIKRLYSITPIWKETGRYWFYEEDMLGGLINEPISQRVTLISKEEDHKVRIQHYTIKNPEQFVNAWFIPERLAALTTDNLVLLDGGCDNLFEEVAGQGDFEYNYTTPCAGASGSIPYVTGYQFLQWEGRGYNLLALGKDKKPIHKEEEDLDHPLMPFRDAITYTTYQRDFNGAVQAYYVNDYLKRQYIEAKKAKDLEAERLRIEAEGKQAKN